MGSTLSSEESYKVKSMNNSTYAERPLDGCEKRTIPSGDDADIEGKLEKDDEGYLVNPESWTPQAATQLANEEEIALSDDHWEIIRFVRSHYEEHRVIPDVRHVAGYLVDRYGISKKTAKARLFNLFPYGYVKQACKIAGMKKPRAWSTG